MSRTLVELTIRSGPFGSDIKTVAVPISEDLTRELFGAVERSDEPFSLLLASPSLYGGKESAVTIRQRVFQMRRDIAEQITRAMVPVLLEAFGVNDELDGYRIEDMSKSERDFYSETGRLPPRHR